MKKTNPEPTNFYFWLGAHGEVTSIKTEEEFEKKQEEIREADRKWKDVDVVSGD